MKKECTNKASDLVRKRRSLAGSKASEPLFQMAKEAAQRANKMSGRSGKEYEAMTAVVLCVVVAEAAINEISEFFDYQHLNPPFSVPSGLPSGFDRLDLRMKWSLLPIIAHKATFDFGAEPWQSFHALVELRNAIVHLRHRPPPEPVYSLLRSKKLIGKYQRVGFKVARWACETMANMVEELTKLLGIPEKPNNFLWPWSQEYFPHGLSTPGRPFKESEAFTHASHRKRPIAQRHNPSDCSPALRGLAAHDFGPYLITGHSLTS
jgi:hypothetical protein